MDPNLLRELVLVRDACREVEFARSPEEIAKVVSQLQEYLSKVIVNHTVAPGLEHHADLEATNIARHAGLSSHPDPQSLLTYLCASDLAGDRDARMLAHQLATVDHRYWRDYVAEMNLELSSLSEDTGENTNAKSPADIDRNALVRFIAAAIPGEDQVTIEDVRTASIGNSKATLLVTLAGNRILPRDVVIRKDQAFNFLGTHVVDEYPALKLLFEHGVPVPEPFALEPTGNVLDFPFLLCSRIEGGALGTIYYPPPRDDKMLASLAWALAKIHCVPVDNLDYIGVKGPQREEYIVAEIEKYTRDWKELDTENRLLDLAFAWVRSNIKDAYGRFSIVHNDYSYHNILIENSEVTAVLDWEFIHIGNPAADLSYFRDDAEQGAGFSFFLEEYARAGGVVPSQAELDFYYIWGHTRFAVMNMQTKVGLQRGHMQGLRPMMPTLHYLPKPMLALGRKLEELLQA